MLISFFSITKKCEINKFNIQFVNNLSDNEMIKLCNDIIKKINDIFPHIKQDEFRIDILYKNTKINIINLYVIDDNLLNSKDIKKIKELIIKNLYNKN